MRRSSRLMNTQLEALRNTIAIVDAGTTAAERRMKISPKTAALNQRSGAPQPINDACV